MKQIVYAALMMLTVAACGLVDHESTSGVTHSYQTPPDARVVETGHLRTRKGRDTALTITCQKSDTGTCHYNVWQVVSDTTKGTHRNIERIETSFTLPQLQSRTFSPALKDSSYCHAADKAPDPVTCVQTKT